MVPHAGRNANTGRVRSGEGGWRGPSSKTRSGGSLVAVLAPAVVGDAVLVDLVVHHPAADAEELRRLLLDPVAALEGLEERGLLELLEVEQVGGELGGHVDGV